MSFFKNKWSNWKDLSIGKVHEYVYLLQFRRHENGKVEFRTAKSEPSWGMSSKELLRKLPKLLKNYTHNFYMSTYYNRKAGFIAGYKAAIKEVELLKQKEDKQCQILNNSTPIMMADAV